MKKAKVMLASIAILAVVGTSFAFSAKKFGGIVWTGTSLTDCPNVLVDVTTTDGAGFQQTYVTIINPAIQTPAFSFTSMTIMN